LELNNTKVICGVYGPRQSKGSEFNEIGTLTCEFKFATFACKGEKKKYMQVHTQQTKKKEEKRKNSRQGKIPTKQQDKEEKRFSNLIVQALSVSVILEKLPKSVVDIYVLVIESDGGGRVFFYLCIFFFNSFFPKLNQEHSAQPLHVLRLPLRMLELKCLTWLPHAAL
jgi:exosome complex component MTR3